MRSWTLAGVLFSAAALATSAQAQFLVDPSGGFVLTNGPVDDISYNIRPLGFTGHYFGQPVTSVDVSSNGFLSFSGNAISNNVPLPTGIQRLCVMWDNLYVYSGQAITERRLPGVYISFTWQVGTFAFGHVAHEAQLVWFGANTRMYGFDFRPDDIVMCYKSIGAPPWNATVGLEGPGGRVAVLPGTTNGYITDANASLLPNFTNSVKWVLYRPDGAGGYSVSIVPCTADLDNGTGTGTRDGGVTIDDLLFFLQRFESGC